MNSAENRDGSRCNGNKVASTVPLIKFIEEYYYMFFFSLLKGGGGGNKMIKIEPSF